ncbi:uncharacterized protein LOC119670695 [Teleopsis dalmanni]|uniref:uncharacterized protein LOC119670695 n=1 Tax=Teleopsis dalmanni TaxID=139649 RepID=UPI0018CF2A65|nr:uncharacterized protein LOC119670695 [Teleopsis dalmanni]
MILEQAKVFLDCKDEFNNTKNQVKIEKEVITPITQLHDFDGREEDWQTFVELFKDYVHNNRNLSSSMKLDYLRSHIKGDARMTISHLLSGTSANYEAAWDTNFDKLLDMKTINSSSVLSLRDAHDQIKQCIQLIESKQAEPNCDKLYAHIIIRKLDKEGIQLYEQYIKKPREINTLKDVFEFLEQQFQTLEAQNSLKTSRINYINPPTNIRIQNNTIQCQCCNQLGHRMYNCKRFMDMSIGQRTSLIRNKQLCEICLSHNNRIKCNSTHKCKKCNKAHNSLLHMEYNLNQRQQNSRNNPKINKEGKTYSTIIKDKKQLTLLPTVLISTKSSDGNIHQLRALVDQGSQVSMVSEKVVQLLILKKMKHMTKLSGVSNTTVGTSNARVFMETSSSNLQSSTILNINSPVIKEADAVGINNIKPWRGKTPTELFKLFFDKEVVELIITESKKYASQNNVTTNILDERLLNRFIGFLLFSGYHKLPEIEHYWRQQNDFGIPIVKEARTRNEFRHVKRFLHIADNNSLDSNDRFAKVTPLIALVNKKFMQFGVFHEYLSIDEQMVPYFGRHSSKMYIRNKPIKFGFKLWVLASSDGYMYSTIPYAGSTQPYDKEIGLGAHVVLKLLENVEHSEWHCVYFDNFFTSFYLMYVLSQKNFLACGTVCRNRLPSNLSLKGKKELKKGESDYAFDKQNGLIYVISWQDNSLVTIATIFESMEPMNSARRYNRTLQKYVNVPQPHAIANYNLHMGGVDMADNAISNYRISIRGKKWWWPLFSNAVNSCLVNAWKLHCFIAKAL